MRPRRIPAYASGLSSRSRRALLFVRLAGGAGIVDWEEGEADLNVAWGKRNLQETVLSGRRSEVVAVPVGVGRLVVDATAGPKISNFSGLQATLTARPGRF